MTTQIARRCTVMLALVNTVIAASAPYERVFAAEVLEQQGGPGAFEFVLAGMRRERDRLASGTFSLEAIWRAEDAEEIRSQGSLVIDGDKVRYELTRPGWVVNPDTIEVTGDGQVAAETMLGMHSLQLAYDGAQVSFWHSENNLITVEPKGLDEEHRRMAQYFDIRGVVLYDPLSIQDGQSLNQQFERLERLSTLAGGGVSWALLGVLTLHAGLVVHGAWVHSPGWDEIGHLPAGLSHWTYGDFRLYRVNPPLVRMVATVPLVIRPPEIDWQDAFASPHSGQEFDVGLAMLERSFERSCQYFTIARWACIPLTLLAGWVCFA